MCVCVCVRVCDCVIVCGGAGLIQTFRNSRIKLGVLTRLFLASGAGIKHGFEVMSQFILEFRSFHTPWFVSDPRLLWKTNMRQILTVSVCVCVCGVRYKCVCVCKREGLLSVLFAPSGGSSGGRVTVT